MSGREQMRRIEADLAELCVRIGERPVGSAGNRRATDYVAGRLRAAGLEVETPGFDCLDWAHGETGLWVGAERVRAFPGPYSPPAAFEAPFETAGSVEELAAKDFRGKAAVLHGGLCREQLMPKNFRFYNPEEHQRIIGLLEAKAPLAVVCITGRCPELAGGQSPFPLIEDGDFELPSVYLTEEEGARLLARRSGRDARGSILRLSLDSRRIPSRGCNVVARRPGAGSQRAVVFAHIDAKPGTPGALDNGTGVAVLLVLADRLAARRRPGTAGGLGVELVALNGEDHYSAAGQMLYLQANAGRFSEIVLGMNVDVAGCVGSQPAYCLFGGEGRLEREARRVLGREAGFPESEPWVQGDHMLFVMNGVPAVAVTSSNAVELFTSVTHTPEDRIERADPAAVAAAFERLIAAAAGSGC